MECHQETWHSQKTLCSAIQLSNMIYGVFRWDKFTKRARSRGVAPWHAQNQLHTKLASESNCTETIWKLKFQRLSHVGIVHLVSHANTEARTRTTINRGIHTYQLHIRPSLEVLLSHCYKTQRMRIPLGRHHHCNPHNSPRGWFHFPTLASTRVSQFARQDVGGHRFSRSSVSTEG